MDITHQARQQLEVANMAELIVRTNFHSKHRPITHLEATECHVTLTHGPVNRPDVLGKLKR
jgi:hypothetical protein